MSIWRDIFAKAVTLFWPPSVKPSDSKALIINPEQMDIDFASSVVALAAKMAKADGITTIEEAQAFRAAFPVNPKDEIIIDKLFSLAGSSVLGYEGYETKIARKFQQNRVLKMECTLYKSRCVYETVHTLRQQMFQVASKQTFPLSV